MTSGFEQPRLLGVGLGILKPDRVHRALDVLIRKKQQHSFSNFRQRSDFNMQKELR
jgi:hypothetical protein